MAQVVTRLVVTFLKPEPSTLYNSYCFALYVITG